MTRNRPSSQYAGFPDYPGHAVRYKRAVFVAALSGFSTLPVMFCVAVCSSPTKITASSPLSFGNSFTLVPVSFFTPESVKHFSYGLNITRAFSLLVGWLRGAVCTRENHAGTDKQASRSHSRTHHGGSNAPSRHVFNRYCAAVVIPEISPGRISGRGRPLAVKPEFSVSWFLFSGVMRFIILVNCHTVFNSLITGVNNVCTAENIRDMIHRHFPALPLT